MCLNPVFGRPGGEGRNRTDCLPVAGRTLYQMSYIPKSPAGLEPTSSPLGDGGANPPSGGPSPIRPRPAPVRWVPWFRFTAGRRRRQARATAARSCTRRELNPHPALAGPAPQAGASTIPPRMHIACAQGESNPHTGCPALVPETSVSTKIPPRTRGGPRRGTVARA